MSVNVLIVDDSSVMRKILERSLRQAQIPVGNLVEAGDGVEALQKLGNGDGFQLIFSDINMPNMDGIEFLRNLKANASLKAVPVIMVTTEGTEAKVLEALQLGAAGYVRKPFTPLQMQQALARIIS